MINKMSKENRRHSSQFRSFSYYKSNIPEYFANVPLHWHSEFELNYILEGCGEFICGDERFVSCRGDIIIIAPNMLHAVYPIEDANYIYDTLVFDKEMLGSLNNDRSFNECIRPIISGNCQINCRITKKHYYYNELRTTAENIISCAKGDTAANDLLLKSELLKLFWLLEESGDIYPKTESVINRSDVIRPAVEYIKANFKEDITVDKLAEISHLSKSYFMSRFKQSAGIGAIEYITHLRIKSACELLTDTDKTVAEIAFESGFHNLSNFNRQFKKTSGCTPSEFRKKQIR